jgi:hypothetical protein
MNLTEINATTLSTKRCWQITRNTLRVDPRCRQKDLLQQYADNLHDQFQAMQADYIADPQGFVRHARKHHAGLYGVMLPFITLGALNGYRDATSVLGIKTNPQTIEMLQRDAQARADFSARTMNQTTVERLIALQQQKIHKIEQAQDAAETKDSIDQTDDIDEVDEVDDAPVDNIDDDELDRVDDDDIDDDVTDDDDPLNDEHIADEQDIEDSIANDIADNFIFSVDRAEAATDFEGTKAYKTGTEYGMKQADNPWMKVWAIDPNLHDRDDECDENEAAGPIAIGEEFPSGDQQDPAHPNCGCNVYYVRSQDA